MSKLTLTTLDARALIALAQSAKAVADIDPIVAEFSRRVAKREAKVAALTGKPGAQASASILGHGRANLAAVQAMRDAIAAPATFVAEPRKRVRKATTKPAPVSVSGIVAEIAQLTAEDRAALRALLA